MVFVFAFTKFLIILMDVKLAALVYPLPLVNFSIMDVMLLLVPLN